MVREPPKFTKIRDIPKKTEAIAYNTENYHVFISYTLEEGIPVIHEVVIRPRGRVDGEVGIVTDLLTLLFRASVPYKDIVEVVERYPNYEEVGKVLREFLSEYGMMEPPKESPAKQETILTFIFEEPPKKEHVEGENLAVCPVCGEKSLKVEEGCYTCLNPECGWSKCE